MAEQRIKELRWVRAADLNPDPRNWRVHSQEQRAVFRQMAAHLGLVNAVIAREDTTGNLVLVDGHLRQDELPPDHLMPVLVVDLDEHEAAEAMATLDPIAGLAGTDVESLNQLIDQFGADMQELMQGFANSLGLGDELADRTNETPSKSEPDEIPDDTPPISKAGTIWQLGDHRLMCGSSLNSNAVTRLLVKDRPRLLITDPPWGVDYDPTWRNRLSAAGRSMGKPANDGIGFDWSKALDIYLPEVCYVWSPPDDLIVRFVDALKSRSVSIANILVWAKDTHAMSRGHYQRKHEVCLYGVREGCAADWIGDRSETTIWNIPNIISWGNRDFFNRNDPNARLRNDHPTPIDVETDHSTQKPVECMERPIRNHEGDVYDPFVGSGTTLIAAERQGRKCYAMEIEPRYVDMAVARWEAYTGRKAEKVMP